MFPPKEKSRLTGERNSAGMLLECRLHGVANKRLGGIGARYTGLVWSATRPFVVMFEEIHRSFASKKEKKKEEEEITTADPRTRTGDETREGERKNGDSARSNPRSYKLASS